MLRLDRPTPAQRGTQSFMPFDPRRVLFGKYATVVPLLLAIAGQVVAMIADGQTFATGASGSIPTWLLFAAGMALMIIAPGWLLIELILPRRESTDALERLLLSIGSGYGVLVTWVLLVHYLPFPFVPGFSTLMIAVLVPPLFLLSRRAPSGYPRPVPRSIWLQVGAVVLLGALLRLPDIGYAEVQGDEATIMLKAASALQGRTDAIFIHKKGPAEILIAAGFYALEDRANEVLVRLPFAFATLAGLAVVYMLGRSMFSPAAGLIAGLLLGLNGFFIGFARIVQYQSIVFLMSALAIWCAWRLMRGTDPEPSFDRGSEPAASAWIGLGAFFVSVGLMAHYDTIFALPPIAWLIWRRWRAAGGGGRRFDIGVAIARADLCRLAWAAQGSTVLLAIFFVPLALHPYFQSTTLDYLVSTRLGGDGEDGLFHNTFLNSATLATFYTSTWLMLGVSLLLLFELGRRLAVSPRRALGAVLGLAITTGFAIALLRPEWTQWGGINVTFPFLLAVAAGGLWLARSDDGWSATWLWFILPLAVYVGLVKSPRTHFHVTFPAWMLIASLPAAAWWRLPGADLVTARRGARRLSLGIVGAVLYLFFAAYAWWTFVQNDVEYRRDYPSGTPPGQWVALPDLPSSGWFGFPYRAGWKTIGVMYGQGLLHGDYHSNEEEWVTNWYTRGQPRCEDRPRYLFLAENVQDERPVPADPAGNGYVLVAEVTLEGRPRIAVWQREDLAAIDTQLPPPASGGPVPRFAIEDAEPLFDDAMSSSRFDTWLPYTHDLELATARPKVDFGGQVRLLAVKTEPPVLSGIVPGERVIVTLLWEALAPMDKDYSVFLHLETEGVRMLAQNDGAPAALGPKGSCGESYPMTGWAEGERIVERRVLEVPADALSGATAGDDSDDSEGPRTTGDSDSSAGSGGSAGDSGDGSAGPSLEIPLLVGLYDYETLERLQVTDSDGTDLGTRYEIATVRITTSPHDADPDNPPWLLSSDPLGAAPRLLEPLRWSP